MIDYDKWMEKHGDKSKKQNETSSRERQLSLFLQAGVSAEHLTHNDDWDRFIGYLESAHGRSKEAAESARHRISSADIVDTGDMLRLKMEIARYDTMTETLEWVMELPKALIQNGNAARELLPEARKEGDAA